VDIDVQFHLIIVHLDYNDQNYVNDDYKSHFWVYKNNFWFFVNLINHLMIQNYQ
jgi:hypothetical protein